MHNITSKDAKSENKLRWDDVLEELLEEAHLLDDHGSVILGRREDKPQFQGDAEKKIKIEKKKSSA